LETNGGSSGDGALKKVPGIGASSFSPESLPTVPDTGTDSAGFDSGTLDGTVVDSGSDSRMSGLFLTRYFRPQNVTSISFTLEFSSI